MFKFEGIRTGKNIEARKTLREERERVWKRRGVPILHHSTLSYATLPTHHQEMIYYLELTQMHSLIVVCVNCMPMI